MKRAGVGLMLASILLTCGCERDTGSTSATATAPATPPASKPVSVGGALDAAVNEAREKTQQAAEVTARIIRDVREKYQQRVATELGRYDEHIRALRARLEQAAADARPGLEQRIADLTEKVQQARELLERLKNAGDEAWKGAEEGLDRALRELRQAAPEVSAATRPVPAATTQPSAP